MQIDKDAIWIQNVLFLAARLKYSVLPKVPFQLVHSVQHISEGTVSLRHQPKETLSKRTLRASETAAGKESPTPFS